MKKILFPFLAIDYRSAQAWLNERAAEGLKLTEIGPLLPISRWESAGVRKQYAVSLWRTEEECWDHRHLAMDFDAFREFAAGAGWDYVCGWGNMRIFEGEAGADLTPFHTDPATELHVFQKLFRRRALIDGIWAAAGILILLLAMFGKALFRLLSYHFFVGCLLVLLGFGLMGGWLLTALAVQLHRDKRAVEEGRALPVLPPRRARRRGLIYWLIQLTALLTMLGCWIADVGSGVWDAQIHGILLWNLLAVAVVNRKAYRRLPWLRYGMTALCVILLITIFSTKGERPESSNSILLSRRDYFAEEGLEENVIHSIRYESRWTFLADRAYRVLREAADQPVEAPGFDRAEGIRTAKGQYIFLLLQREGQVLGIDVFGNPGQMALHDLLAWAEGELG